MCLRWKQQIYALTANIHFNPFYFINYFIKKEKHKITVKLKRIDIY